MAKVFQISGARKIANNILIQKNKMLGRIAVAVEKTGVDVKTHAQANHTEGVAHGMGRFERKSGLLQKNIEVELETVTFKEVTATVSAMMEYAIPVEFGTSKTRAYPFMFPALIANQENLKKRVAEAKV